MALATLQELPQLPQLSLELVRSIQTPSQAVHFWQLTRAPGVSAAQTPPPAAQSLTFRPLAAPQYE